MTDEVIEGESKRVPEPQPTQITQAELCMKIAQVIDGNLLQMTGRAEGLGPAFALIMWADGMQPVDFGTNRTKDELFVRAMTVVKHIAAEQRESLTPPVVPLIVRPH